MYARHLVAAAVNTLRGFVCVYFFLLSPHPDYNTSTLKITKSPRDLHLEDLATAASIRPSAHRCYGPSARRWAERAATMFTNKLRAVRFYFPSARPSTNLAATISCAQRYTRNIIIIVVAIIDIITVCARTRCSYELPVVVSFSKPVVLRADRGRKSLTDY